MAMMTFITTCKNRLAHLKETLPLMVKQSFSEVIVVDYGCEQGTSNWVAEAAPDAKVVRVLDDPRFSLARARNIGAMNAGGELLCFIDADMRLEMDLGKWAQENVQPGCFYVSGQPKVFELCGFLICSRSMFEQAGGYDEAYRGWGGEDGDLLERLEMAGHVRSPLPEEALTAITHGDDLRQFGKNDPEGFATKNHALALQQCYKLMKFDIIRLNGRQPDIDVRKKLHSSIRTAYGNAVANGSKDFTITLNVPPRHADNRFSHSQRKLVYRIPITHSRLAAPKRRPAGSKNDLH